MIARVPKTYGSHIFCTVAVLALTLASSSQLDAQTFAAVPALSFVKPFARANPLPQILTVASTGAAMRFTASAATTTGGNWLEISPEGLGCCTTPDAITVSVKARPGLPVGIYHGSISITSYPATTHTMNIPVTLTIAALDDASLDNVPGHLSFSMKPGGDPPPQLLRIPKAGPGALNWSATTTTANNGNWLKVSAAAGAAPAFVAVSVVPQSLPGGGTVPGTYVGQVRIEAGGAAATIPVSMVVGISVLAQINPLHFTMPFGGPNPLPQILTVASTGTAIRFSPVAATAKGGDWLQVSPESTGCCTTPDALTVSVSARPGMAAGVYTAQLTLFQYPSRSLAITVPVTLTVARANKPYFDDLPGQLSFALKPGASVPQQTVQVRNGGAGTLNWTLSKSTADGGNWLDATTTPGAAPSVVKIAIEPQALPGGGQIAGTFVGQVMLRAPGTSVSIPVAVVIGASVFQQVNPISFTMPFAGANPLPQILVIASSGSSIRFTPVAATARGGNWLRVSPQSTGCCTTPEAITVAVDAATLPAGSYTGQITFFVYPNRSISMTVPVNLTVAGAGSPFLDNVPGQLSFSLKPGATASPQTIQVRNRGAGTLNWTLSATTADGRNWLTASGAGTTPSTVAVRIDPQALPGGGQVSGTFIGQLLIESVGSSFTIPVTATVGSTVFTQVNPLSFIMAFGGASPLPKALTIASTGTAIRFTPVPSTATGGDWLRVSPSSTGCCTTPHSISVSINAPQGLPPGVYTGQIAFLQYPSNALAMTVPVTLTVAAAGSAFFDNMPGQLSFALQPGGAASAQTVLVRNGGSGSLAWTLAKTTADGGNWLRTSVANGVAPSNVAVMIAPQALPGGGQIAGTYAGQLVFRSASGTATIEVVVVVGARVFRQLNPVSFVMPFGGANPLPQILTIASTGTDIRFTPAASTSHGGDWLQVTPQSLGCCTTPEAITVSVEAQTLPAGVYIGEITFTSYPDQSLTMTVPVSLTVAPAGTSFFGNTPGHLSFFMKPGGTPPNQTVEIRNDGSGTLNFTVAKSTSDGGDWLNIIETEAAAPEALVVGITPSALPGGGAIAGSYVGQVVLRGGGSSVTVPVTVVVGASVFSQVNPLSFTMRFGGPNPLPQTLTAASTGSAIRLTPVVATATGGEWLQVSPRSTGCCSTPVAFAVNVNAPAAMPAGSYTAQITFIEYPSNSIAMTVPVTLTVAPGGGAFFDNVPGQLSFSMLPGGNLAPQTVAIRNGGAGSLAWTLSKATSDAGNWLGVSAQQGTAPSVITVTITPQDLPGGGLVAGAYIGQLVFRAPANSVTVPVIVMVGNTVFNQPGSVSFATQPGINPPPQVLNVTSTGGAIRFTPVPASGKGGNWLQVSPQSLGCCTTAQNLTVSVNAAGLPAGTYTGQITVVQYPGNMPTMTIPVYLTVGN